MPLCFNANGKNSKFETEQKEHMNKQTVRFPNCLSIWTNLMIFVENVWLEFDLFLLFFFPFLGLFASNRNRTACLSLYLEWVNWFYFAFFRWINLVGFFAAAADIIIQCEVPCTQTLIHCLVDRYSLLLLFGLFIHSFARSFVLSFLVHFLTLYKWFLWLVRCVYHFPKLFARVM